MFCNSNSIPLSRLYSCLRWIYRSSLSLRIQTVWTVFVVYSRSKSCSTCAWRCRAVFCHWDLFASCPPFLIPCQFSCENSFSFLKSTLVCFTKRRLSAAQFQHKLCNVQRRFSIPCCGTNSSGERFKHEPSVARKALISCEPVIILFLNI